MSDWQEQRVKEVEATVKHLEAKLPIEQSKTTRHMIWAIVCMVALVGTALIISHTIIALAKIHLGAK